jgi:hypothetical protein
MKRSVCSVLVVLFVIGLVVTGQAQSRHDEWPRQAWTAGVTIGPISSSLSGDYITTSESHFGMMVGGLINYRVSLPFAVSLEANFNSRQAQNIITSGGDSLYNFRATYVEFPLVATLMQPIHKNWDVGVHAGISLGFNTSAGMLLKDSILTVEPSPTTPGGEVNSTMWTLPLGAGFAYYFPGSNSALVFAARYSLGLSNVFKDANNKAKWNTMQFMLRYMFQT